MINLAKSWPDRPEVKGTTLEPGAPSTARTAVPTRQHRELMRAWSLLFVAATRARDALLISWHGQPSRFLPPVP